MLIAEHHQSFGDLAYLGQEGTPIEIAIPVFDEDGRPLTDATREFAYTYEAWPKLGAAALNGNGLATIKAAEPGILRIPITQVPKDTDFSIGVGGRLSLFFLPRGQERKASNYLPVFENLGVYFQKAPAKLSSIYVSLKDAIERRKGTIKEQETKAEKDNTLLYIAIGIAVIAVVLVIPMFAKRGAALSPPHPAV